MRISVTFTAGAAYVNFQSLDIGQQIYADDPTLHYIIPRYKSSCIHPVISQCAVHLNRSNAAAEPPFDPTTDDKAGGLNHAKSRGSFGNLDKALDTSLEKVRQGRIQYHSSKAKTTAKMFKKDVSPGSKSKVKSSVQRALRTQLCTIYPLLTPYIDEIIPKKEQLDAMKIPERVTLYLIGPTPIFFQHMTDPLLPHLKLVHRFPQCFPTVRIDRGAIRFVLSGATLMAPGLTSTGGRLPSGGEGDAHLEKGQPVCVSAEGKEEVCAVGLLSIGTKEVVDVGKGPVVEDGHFLGDGLWRLVTE